MQLTAQQCGQLAALNHLGNNGYQPQLTLLEDKGNEQERLIRWQWQLGQPHGQLVAGVS
ncbi:hypothetical protein [Vreelandella olivaria]|uniref:hypothetical protein n=1 Tax=Vreelandella olivaria TaxID=390919 RepID=UPI00201ECE82|nr:hypothetical protein [Halomonas olivaria]